MPFTLSPATDADIPGLISVWNSAFGGPATEAIFPDTATGRAWRHKSFERSMHSPTQNSTHMVVTEDSEDGTRKVVAFGRYFKYSEGEFNQDWKTRWEPELPVDMKDETLGDGFMDPLARQQRAVMAERAHWFLEVLATDKEYQKQGHGSRILEWGCAEADSEGLELYLDAGKLAQPLYTKFGFVAAADAKDPKAVSTPMLRPAKKIAV